MDQSFIERAEACLGNLPGLEGFRISSADQISGNGLSRSVFRVMGRSERQPQERGYVLLIEQSTSPVAPNRDAEFAVLRALAGVPSMRVAPAYWVESDPEPLGAPFLLTGLLPGTTNPNALLKPEHAPHARQVVEQSIEMLGQLAAVDVDSVALGPALAVPDRHEVWRVELDRIEKTIRDCDCPDLVVTAAALRWLRRTTPPAPPKLSIVHGDYRLGNYLFDASGLTGVIDWEMAHVGDAVEDLAWSLLPLWEFAARPGLVGGFLAPHDVVALWERASGLLADPASLQWWTLFCHVKALSIWATARHMFASGKESGIWPALVGYAMCEKQESLIAPVLKGMTR